jgi:sugar phosphate isomerase/epimerase
MGMKFEVHQSMWGMIGLPRGGPEWSMEEKFERIAAAGFTGILDFMPEPAQEKRYRALLDRYGFTLGVHSFPRQVSDIVPLARRAKDFGVRYLNSQVQDSFVIDREAIDLLRGLHEACAEIGIPIYFETHRGRVTQDLLRTVSYVRALPQLRLTLDLSHYVVAGDVSEPSLAMDAAFETFYPRASCIHARVSNGKQVQVDIGDGTHGPVLQFLKWWDRALRAWRANAKPGDLFPFVVELGPPLYSITEGERETSDRWAQALVFKRLAEKLWVSA